MLHLQFLFSFSQSLLPDVAFISDSRGIGYTWWLSSRIRNKKMHAYNGNPISLDILSSKIKSDFPTTDASSKHPKPLHVTLLNTFIANVNQKDEFFSFTQTSDLHVEEFYQNVTDAFKDKVILKCAAELIGNNSVVVF